MMMVEGLDELESAQEAAPAPPPPPPPPPAMGERLEREAVPTSYRISKRTVESTVRKLISNRVRLPRAQASMRISFKLDLAPLAGVKTMCEEAGLQLVEAPRRCGSLTKRKWRADGPAATSRFAQLNKAHPLGWGGGKLAGPAKADRRQRARVVTLLAPPLTVEHKAGRDEETATIKAHLVTFNQEGSLGLPPRHEEIWGDAAAATKKALTKYAKRMLGEMFVELLPISQTFLKNLGPQYCSSGEEEDSDWEPGDE